MEFCYLNSKSNRKKLVRALFNVPRTSLELLPYYSRMVATLSTSMKDVSSILLQMLEEEFNFLINKKVNFTFFYWRSFLLSALNSANYIWYLVFEMCFINSNRVSGDWPWSVSLQISDTDGASTMFN